jgi:general stress protein 26
MNTEGLTKLRSLLKGARICMLTTRDEDGNLRSRPMAMQEKEADADLWFFAARHSPKMDEVHADDRVNVSIVNGNAYISISGRATEVEDRKKAEELWSPAYKVYFPKGLEDPELVLLKVSMDYAEFWDSPGGLDHIVRVRESARNGRTSATGRERRRQSIEITPFTRQAASPGRGD